MAAMMQGVQKNTLYVGGLAEEVNEAILHAAFIPFGDIKDVKTPLDQATQKHRSFGFVTFLEREDAQAAMDNMDGSELYGRVLTVNYALPERIKGGEQGWAAQPSISLSLSLSQTLVHDFMCVGFFFYIKIKLNNFLFSFSEGFGLKLGMVFGLH